MSTRPLFTSQEACVQSMVQREQDHHLLLDAHSTLHTPVSILGGSIGSGKTSTILELIHRHKGYAEVVTVDSVTQLGTLSYIRTTHRHTRSPVTLVLADRNIRHQWQHECTYFPTLRVKRVDTATASNLQHLQETLDSWDVVLVSHTVLAKLVAVLPQHQFWRLVVDEADTLQMKIPGALCAAHIWYVTATWTNLQPFTQSSLRRHQGHFLYDTLHDMPLQPLVAGQQMEAPHVPFAVQEQVHTYVDTPVYRALRTMITDEHMRRLESGDVQSVVSELSGTYNASRSLFDVMYERAARERESAQNRLQEARTARDAERIQHWHAKLQTTTTRLADMQARVRLLLAGSCSICCDRITNPILTRCHHLFCTRCLMQWLQQNSTCPMCRAPVQLSGCHVFGAPGASADVAEEEEKETEEKEEETSTRHGCVARTMYQNPSQVVQGILNSLPSSARILLFAQFDDNLVQILPEGSRRLVGHISSRKRQIEAFRAGDTRILVLSSVQACAGLHLPETTDIIFLHRLDQAFETQCIGRAQRPGRTEPLTVHYIVPEEGHSNI